MDNQGVNNYSWLLNIQVMSSPDKCILYLLAYIFVNLFTCLFVNLFTCLFVNLFVCLFVNLFACLLVCLFVQGLDTSRLVKRLAHYGGEWAPTRSSLASSALFLPG